MGSYLVNRLLQTILVLIGVTLLALFLPLRQPPDRTGVTFRRSRSAAEESAPALALYTAGDPKASTCRLDW